MQVLARSLSLHSSMFVCDFARVKHKLGAAADAAARAPGIFSVMCSHLRLSLTH